MSSSGLEMVGNAVCTLKIDGKLDLLTIFFFQKINKRAMRP